MYCLFEILGVVTANSIIHIYIYIYHHQNWLVLLFWNPLKKYSGKVFLQRSHLINVFGPSIYFPCQGKVDCHWSFEPRRSLQYYRTRVDFLKRVHHDNLALYKLISSVVSTVKPVKCTKYYRKLTVRQGHVIFTHRYQLEPSFYRGLGLDCVSKPALLHLDSLNSDIQIQAAEFSVKWR